MPAAREARHVVAELFSPEVHSTICRARDHDHRVGAASSKAIPALHLARCGSRLAHVIRGSRRHEDARRYRAEENDLDREFAAVLATSGTARSQCRSAAPASAGCGCRRRSAARKAMRDDRGPLRRARRARSQTVLGLHVERPIPPTLVDHDIARRSLQQVFVSSPARHHDPRWTYCIGRFSNGGSILDA